jgi:DNA-binding IclR family transcriptional regulator
MNKIPSQTVYGLVDGLAVLQEMAMSPEPVSGLAVARKLNLSPIRVNRLLKTLAYLGLAYRTSSRRYAVGSGMHVIAAQSMAASGLLRRSFVHLDHLAKYGYLVALGVLWKDKVCYLYYNSGAASVDAGLSGMVLYPALESSIGMSLLAELPAEDVKALFHEQAGSELFSKLDEIRKKGWAMVKHRQDLSLAVNIGSPAYAAIAVSGFKTSEELEMFIRLLREAAKSIERG